MLNNHFLTIATQLALVFASLFSLAGTPRETSSVISRFQPGPEFFTVGRDSFDQEVQWLLKRARFSSERLPISHEWIAEVQPLPLTGEIIISDHDDLDELLQL